MQIVDRLMTTSASDADARRCPHDGTTLVSRMSPLRSAVRRCPTCLRSWPDATVAADGAPPARFHSFRLDVRPEPAAPSAAPPSPELSIVLPALNEAAALPLLIGEIETALSGESYELVLVDDGSDDATWTVIRAVLADRPQWQAVRLSRRFGHQAALLAGLAAARGRAVISMDADGQHPPEQLPEMVRRWRDGARVVQAVRASDARGGTLKALTSRGFYRVFGRLCEAPMRSGAADFRLLDRAVVATVLRASQTAPFLRGLIPWLGFETHHIMYEPCSRIAGRTKYSLRRMARLATDGMVSFSVAPLRLATLVGAAVGALALADLIYIVAVALWDGRAVPGWASTVGLVALLGAVQLFSIGLLGEYVGRTYLALLNRPPYVVAERIGDAGGGQTAGERRA